MTTKVSDFIRVVTVCCPLAIIFIAIPGALAKMAFLKVALSPNVLPLWLDLGMWGYIFVFALPMLLSQITGNVIGFCAGVFIFCRLFGREKVSHWLLDGRQIPLFSHFALRIVDLACKGRA